MSGGINEIFLISFPHIIVYPRAVTVHSSDATLTNSTVMCSWWPIHFTFLVTEIANWLLSDYKDRSFIYGIENFS